MNADDEAGDDDAANAGRERQDQPESAGEAPPGLIDFAHRMFDLARDGSDELVAYVGAGLSPRLTNAAGDSLLMLAAYHGHAALSARLIELGADVNAANDKGQTPLAGTVFKAYREVAEVLLAAGADPDLGTPSARATAAMFESEIAEMF